MMGGRITAAATSGAVQQQGEKLRHPAQNRLEVACLHVGFVWLGFGLFAHATAGILDPAFLPTAIHGVTIGALGTFSLAIMTRTVEQRARVPIQLPGPIIAAILLISVAGMARLAADIVPAVPAMVLTSAVAWSCAFAIFLWQLVRFSRA